MKTLSFKHYPPSALVVMICFLIALQVAIQFFYQQYIKHASLSAVDMLLMIVLSYGAVSGMLSIINRYFAYPWVLRILNNCDLRGRYKGKLISSFREENAVDTPRSELYMELYISQNLNGFSIAGNVFTDASYSSKSSSFAAADVNLQRLDDGRFQLSYFYSNKGYLFHPDHDRFMLNNHDGVCILMVDKKIEKLSGYYYTHERRSHGSIELSRI